MEITDLQGSPRKTNQAEGVKKTETDLQRMLQRSEPNMCRDGCDRWKQQVCKISLNTSSPSPKSRTCEETNTDANRSARFSPKIQAEKRGEKKRQKQICAGRFSEKQEILEIWKFRSEEEDDADEEEEDGADEDEEEDDADEGEEDG
jgi:hypothetical protein